MIKLESESQFNSLKKENTVFEFTKQDGALTVVSSNLIYHV